jgi:voltage-gated potassium channel
MTNPSRRFLQIIFALIAVIALGTVGYKLIEGWSLLDSIYMTVITISTVGYTEVHALSQAGRIFTIVLIISGVGVLFYGVTTVVQYVIEGNLEIILGRRRMKDKISKLKGHIIVCGFGRVGKEVARVFQDEGVEFVVVDNSKDSIAEAAASGYLYVEGNASSDEVLKEAGIINARGLVAAAGSDADNVFVTLSARGLRPDIFITARANAQESEFKLRRAGADRTIYPHVLGGRRLAMLALRPLVVDFVDTALESRGKELVLENIGVGPGSPVVGKTCKEGQRCGNGAVILAVRKKDGRLFTSLSDEMILELGDQLIVIGNREQLRDLEGTS